MVTWMYDLILWFLSLLVDLFFREVHPRGSWKVPKRGPVILVAAPHANQVRLYLVLLRCVVALCCYAVLRGLVLIMSAQFVDSLILMRVMRMELHRRIAFLIAQKSFKRRFVGLLARFTGSVPVTRAMDNLKPGKGTIYLPDPINNPTLLRGRGTDFTSSAFEVGGTILLPSVNGQSSSTDISEIQGPEEIILKKPFKTQQALQQLTGRDDVDESGNFTGGANVKSPAEFQGSRFKVAPHVDQTQVYNAVFDTLNQGGCIGIFPEGGSHDRPDLLPLKGMHCQPIDV